MNRVTVSNILDRKGKEKIAALTAYDFPTATLMDEAGVDLLLVGDSVGNVIYGYENTLPVTMEMMVRHTEAVSRAAHHALVVADLPFGSYQPSIEIAVQNASRFLAEGRAQAVKLEGGANMESTIRRLVDIGIPVMGHVGLTPQSVHQLGYRTRGKESAEAERIHQDALAVERAGAFSVVLECLEPGLASEITSALKIPTIGIGSGEHCDGQILVSHDLFGHTVGHIPKFVVPLANLRETITNATRIFVKQVKEKH